VKSFLELKTIQKKLRATLTLSLYTHWTFLQGEESWCCPKKQKGPTGYFSGRKGIFSKRFSTAQRPGSDVYSLFSPISELQVGKSLISAPASDFIPSVSDLQEQSTFSHHMSRSIDLVSHEFFFHFSSIS